MSNENKEATIHELHTYVIIRCMTRAGWATDEAIEALGLKPVTEVNENSLIPMSRFFEICHRANEVNNDPLYCLKLGKYCHPIDYGILGKLAMFSSNVGEALKLIYRYQTVVNSTIKNSIVFTENMAISPISIGEYDSELAAPLIEFRISAFFNIGHFVTGAIHPNLFHDVCFQHSAKADLELYRAVLGTPVRFNQPRSSFSMSLSSMDIPIFCADADLNKVALSHAKAAEQDNKGTSSISQRIREHIRAKLFLGIPSQEDMAERLGMSNTKLKRCLAEEDTSYRELCNNMRKETATHLLLATNKSINEVGIMLGFSQTSSFVRSFKSWTGETPQQFRHAHR